MTDLTTTGPSQIDLRWGTSYEERPDGRVERDLYPTSHHQDLDGYLHPGIAAAAVIGAAEKTVGLPDRVGSVALALEAPVPLGMDLRAVVDQAPGGVRGVTFEVIDRSDREHQPVHALGRGTVRDVRDEEVVNEGAFRSAALAPVPDPVDNDIHAGCFVCGPDNPQGLGLPPGRQSPDTVVTGFIPNDRMSEDGRVPPTMVAALLSCPTLWACRAQLDDVGAPAALLSTYEVRFLDDVPAGVSLRTVGLAGEPGDGTLHGSSALLTEDGRVHAVATAGWRPVDEVPGREPGRPAPRWTTSPSKGGRPEARSGDDWGQRLPGRRETAGPRSERPSDHDGRDAAAIDPTTDDPSDRRRSIEDDG